MAGVVVLGLGADSKLIAVGYGGPAVTPLAPSDVETEFSAPIGVTIDSPQTLLVGGRAVSKPVTFSQEGCYELAIPYEGGVRKWWMMVVNPQTVVTSIEGFANELLSGSLTRPYANTIAVQLDGSPNAKLRVGTNKAVVLAVGTIDPDGTRHRLGKVAAYEHGTWDSTALLLQTATTNLKLWLEMYPSRIILQVGTYPSEEDPLGGPYSTAILLPTGQDGHDDCQSDVSVAGITQTAAVAKLDPNWDDSTYLLMRAESHEYVSWQHETYSPPTGLQQIAYVEVLYRVARDESLAIASAFVSGYAIHVDTAERFHTPLEQVTAPAPGYVNLVSRFTTNPLTGRAWQPGDLSGQGFRFGIARSGSAPLRCSAVNIRVAQEVDQ